MKGRVREAHSRKGHGGAHNEGKSQGIPQWDMEAPTVEACAEFVDGVASRDVHLNELLWVRIFVSHTKPGYSRAKPVVLYAHGGSYCFGQPNWPSFHTFCSSMCKQSDCIWVSLSYRLAPAHRLPAAYDDGFFALQWLAQQQLPSQDSDPWLTPELADFSNFFLAGESAGACIVLKAAMDAAPLDLKPLCIKGLLLIHPGFHSEEKIRASTVEIDLDNVNVKRVYRMALPIGETLDYAPINPIHAAAPPLTALTAYPHMLICVAGVDFRYERTMEFYKRVRGVCPHVELVESPGRWHAFYLDDPFCEEAQSLRAHLVRFIYASIES